MFRSNVLFLTLIFLGGIVTDALGNLRIAADDSGTMVRLLRISDPDDPAGYTFSPHLFFTRDPQDALRRGFLFFDLAPVIGTVDDAALRFYVNRLSDPPPGPGSFSVTAYDYTTAADASRREQFEDLGSGKNYGSGRILESDVGSIVQLELNDEAINDINSIAKSNQEEKTFGVGLPAFGGHYTSSLHLLDPELELQIDSPAVPEPQSLIIFGIFTCLGLGACAVRSRTGRNHAA